MSQWLLLLQRPWPLRLRLTLWYLLTFSLILLLSGFILYWQIERSLLAQIDAALQLVASQAQVNVDASNNHFAFQNVEKIPWLSRRFSDDMGIFLLDAEGMVLDRVGNDAELHAFPPKIGLHTYRENEDGWRVYTEPVRGQGEVISSLIQVVQSQEPAEETLMTLQFQLLWGLPLALGLAGVGGYFLASRALAPIDRITRTARAINSKDLAQRINYIGPADEVGRLAATFDGMLDRLQEGFERERRFTGDAAHELRTPLAALKGRIGVTLSQTRKPPEYTATLQEMEQQVDRLIRLSNDLLFMARLDQQQLSIQKERIDLDALLGALVDQVRPMAENKAIHLALTVPPQAMIQGDIDLLIRLFLNLLDNAVKYTPVSGQITVQVQETASSSVTISVSDSGPGIPPKDLPHLFERFYRVEGARSRLGGTNGDGGAGLGLAIAHEIASVHGGTLKVRSTVGQGSTLIVSLPQKHEPLA